MGKGARTSLEKNIDHGQVEEEPEEEAGQLERRLGDVEAGDDLPGDVDAEGDERNWGITGGQGAANHEDIAKKPENDAEAEETRGGWDEPDGRRRRRHIGRAHGGELCV